VIGRSLFLVALCNFSLYAAAVEQYGYRVTDKKPQSREHWVQGLEIHDGELYLGTGHYGQSRLLRYKLEDGSLLDQAQLHPRLFGEGITVFDDKIYQLTWRARQALVFDKASFEHLGWFPIPGEGWGMTHNTESLIYSDGSEKLHFLSPQTRKIISSLTITENGRPVYRLNELEWVEGVIWANIWRSDRIVIIDPDTGKVTGSVNLEGLLPVSQRRGDTNVLNGIARNPADGTVWVTGKYWPWMYQIELVPLQKHTPGTVE